MCARATLRVVEICDRWKVVTAPHSLLDFGPGQGNAVAALHFIRKNRFDEICFVGRPDPSMTYFKTHGRRRIVIDLIDPRRIEAAIDPPFWWLEQDRLAVAKSPWLDLSAECPGAGPTVREYAGFVIEARGVKRSEVVERNGITGLAVGPEIAIRLNQPAEVGAVGIAHFG